MPEIVFTVVPLGLERVERFVLDLPACRSGRGQGSAKAATVPRPTGRSVMTLLRSVTSPARLTISIMNRLTLIALASPRSGASQSH